ncbi:MAG: hypothetical protein HUJ26_10010 [Planctomycetaceae bacterium]|nr:hypothetical protein [Planctomycetaceae bacterium]
MSSIIELHGIELKPVVELEPSSFSTENRTSPQGSFRDMPDAWDHYWRASMADSGITEINPIFPGSWHIATAEFSTFNLEKYLGVIVDDWGGLSSLDNRDSRPVLNGGLALCSKDSGVIVEPTCCSDLGDIANWKAAVAFEGEHWETLWIGHPWLSMKFRQPWLLLSDLHESNDPVERWAVKPDELGHAVSAAEAELSRLSKVIASVLVNCGYKGDAVSMSLKLVGLDDE